MPVESCWLQVRHSTYLLLSAAANNQAGLGTCATSCHREDDCDILLAAATHVSAAAAHAITLIQAQARGWLVRKHISGVSGLRDHLSEEQKHGKDAAAANDEEQRRDLQRQLHPKTAADFAILHEKVRQWMAQVTLLALRARLHVPVDSQMPAQHALRF